MTSQHSQQTSGATPDPAAGIDVARLRRLLGGQDTAWLVDRIRRRMADGRALDTVVTLDAASPEQRRAVERLLGRAPASGRSLSVRLADLDTALRVSQACPSGLADAIRVLVGPVPDRRALSEQRRLGWESAARPLRAAGRDELAGWLADIESTGLLKRLSGDDPAAAAELCDSAARVLAELPSPGISLSLLAARTTGDAHALDDGRPLATLVLSAVRALAGLTPTATANAEGRRAAWSAVGVARDDLSSRVLALGLPGSARVPRLPADLVGQLLAAAREAGEPVVLTLRQLRRAEPAIGVGAGTVFVCENPAVIAAAADELGARCPPLVCVEGQLSAAARTLLSHLAEQGARFAYHGDFDWGGVRIATSVFDLAGAIVTPWRFDAVSYLAAVDRGHGSPLATGAATDASWDAALRPAIERHMQRVEEEHVIDDLIADLRAAADEKTES